MKNWDSKKKAAFTQAMGKKKFSKGGMVRRLANRKYFDDGGPVTEQSLTTLGGPRSGGVHENAANPNTGILGTIGGALGLNNNYQAAGADIQPGTNAEQLNNEYAGVQRAFGNQEGMTNILAPQAGAGVANQNLLAEQLAGMTRGEGPNPALNQLHQATAENVANQAALMAGQRGSSANAGLLARQAAQQGAKIQQDAAGQAATLQAQQQIAAQNNLANLAGNQINQAGTAANTLNQARQNEQTILQNANTAANSAAVGMQSNINNVNAQTAAGNQGMAGKILGGVTSAVSGIGFKEGGVVGKDGQPAEKEHHIKLAEMNAAAIMHGRQNFAQGGAPSQLMTGPITPAHSNWGSQFSAQSSPGPGPNIEATHIETPKDSGDFDKIGNKIGGLFKKDSANQSDEEARQGYLDADSMLGVEGVDNASEMLPAAGGPEDLAMFAFDGGKVGPHKSHVANICFAEGGEVPAMVSPQEVYLSPEKVRKVIREGADPMRIGHVVPGAPKVKGKNSLKNDTVPMTLEEGGVVIPLSVTKHKMASEKARQFVQKAVARKKARR